MPIVRWLLTFLAFPLGGLLAVLAVGSVVGPATAALAGGLAGAVIGAAQGLALRGDGGWLRWASHTAAAMAAGSAVATAMTGAATTVPALVLAGLLTGVAVGAAQGVLLGRGRRVAALWAVVVGLAWAAGWLTTANVIVDADRGYTVFGSSGALLVTVVTGLALRRILGPARGRGPAAAPSLPAGRAAGAGR